MAKQTRSTRRKAKAKAKTIKRRKAKVNAKAKTMKKPQRRTRLGLMKRKRFTRKSKRGGVSDRLRKEEREIFRRYNDRNSPTMPNRFANEPNWREKLKREYEMTNLRDNDENRPIMANPDAKAAEWHKIIDTDVEDPENEILKQECKTEENDCTKLIEAVKKHIQESGDEKFLKLTEQSNFDKIIKDAIFGKLDFPWEKYPYYWERQGRSIDHRIVSYYRILLKNPHFTLDDDFTKRDKLIPINTRHLITNSITNLKKFYALKYINENPEDEDVKIYNNQINKIEELHKMVFPSKGKVEYYEYDDWYNNEHYVHPDDFGPPKETVPYSTTYSTTVIRDPGYNYKVTSLSKPDTDIIRHPHQRYNYIRETIDILIKTIIFNKFKNKGPAIEEEKEENKEEKEEEEKKEETYGFDEQLQSEAPAIDFGDEEL